MLHVWVPIPSNYMEAMQFGKENHNSKWYDAIKLEKESMQSYKVFKSGIRQFLTKPKRPSMHQRISQDQGASSVCCQV